MFKARRRFNLKAFNNSDKINNFQRNLRRFQSEDRVKNLRFWGLGFIKQ